MRGPHTILHARPTLDKHRLGPPPAVSVTRTDSLDTTRKSPTTIFIVVIVVVARPHVEKVLAAIGIGARGVRAFDDGFFLIKAKL